MTETYYLRLFELARKDTTIYIPMKNDKILDVGKLVRVLKPDEFLSEWYYQPNNLLGFTNTGTFLPPGPRYEHHIHNKRMAVALIIPLYTGFTKGNPKLLHIYSKPDLEKMI